MQQHARVQRGTRSVTIQTHGAPGIYSINVLVEEHNTTTHRHQLGLTMRRSDAEVLRDGLTAALEATKPPPSKADRIREILTDPLRKDVCGNLSQPAQASIRNILEEEGEL